MRFIHGDYILLGGELYRVIENNGDWGSVLHLESNTMYDTLWEYQGEVATKQIVLEYIGEGCYPAEYQPACRKYYVLHAWDSQRLEHQCIYEPDGTYVAEARSLISNHTFEILNERFYILELSTGEIYNICHPYNSYRKAIQELTRVQSCHRYDTSNQAFVITA